MRRFVVVLACAVGALGVLGACGSGSDKSSSGAGGSGGSGGSGGVSLDASDNAFSPAQLTARAGQKITVVLKNEGATLHNFSIDAVGVSKDVEAGKKATITFTPPSAGTISFYCRYHQALGMTGTIVVSG
jgi:plastocyanin